MTLSQNLDGTIQRNGDESAATHSISPLAVRQSSRRCDHSVPLRSECGDARQEAAPNDWRLLGPDEDLWRNDPEERFIEANPRRVAVLNDCANDRGLARTRHTVEDDHNTAVDWRWRDGRTFEDLGRALAEAHEPPSMPIRGDLGVETVTVACGGQDLKRVEVRQQDARLRGRLTDGITFLRVHSGSLMAVRHTSARDCRVACTSRRGRRVIRAESAAITCASLQRSVNEPTAGSVRRQTPIADQRVARWWRARR